jgi:hypothetical protein
MTTIDGAARWARGSDLPLHIQEQAKAQFVHRFTGDHKPRWAEGTWKDARGYPVHFADDAEWLANTLFAVTVAGFLDRRVTHCHSTPTWPHNPELRPRGGSGLPSPIATAGSASSSAAA